MLQSHADELSPELLNHLRAHVHRIFALAIRGRLWTGANPASGVERRKVPRRIYETLRADEVPLLLTRPTPAWRPVFATAIWTGMRKGEPLGLRKSNVDLEAGTITIRCSYDSDTTKGGHADVIPIAEPRRPACGSEPHRHPGDAYAREPGAATCPTGVPTSVAEKTKGP